LTHLGFVILRIRREITSGYSGGERKIFDFIKNGAVHPRFCSKNDDDTVKRAVFRFKAKRKAQRTRRSAETFAIYE
jgi:hypothetical protein